MQRMGDYLTVRAELELFGLRNEGDEMLESP